jgi:transcriptional regulator with XRE-family HTH domain
VKTVDRDGGSPGGPTVRRMVVGAQLRRLRETNGVTREDAGYAIRASESKISRMELGRVSFKERDVADLLTLYGVVDDAERAALLALANDANLPGWWHSYSDLLPAWLQQYLDLEAGARLIRTYEVQFVPGLLQTEAYARAVIELGYIDDAEIDRRVGLRMARKRLLDQPDSPLLWAVLDEAVLRRPIGGREVMLEQLEALAEAGTRPNIRLQIIPFDTGGHPAAGGAFAMLRFPEPELPDVVYVEHLTGALYLDKPEDVDRYVVAMDQLSVMAAPMTRTKEMLDAALRSFR